MKTCSRCKIPKDLSEFCRNRSASDGLSYHCRRCRSQVGRAFYAKNPERGRQRAKNWNQRNPERARKVWKRAKLKSLYGITLEKFEAMLRQQGGNCGICGEPMELPHVDHCHETRTIRGLLCTHCNCGIGQLKHSPNNLRAALRYLDRNGDNVTVECNCGVTG